MNSYQPKAGPESFGRVLIKRDRFTDEGRAGRRIPFKIYHPETPGTYPLVVWSHGLGGSADGAAFLARFISEHGYVVAHVQHPGTDSSLWEGKHGHPWDIIRTTPIPRSATFDRFIDVGYFLDHLPSWLQSNGIDADFSRAGMCGHSYGALTTQIMAGQTYRDDDGNWRSFRLDRFRAGILYSPVPASSPVAYEGIKLPLLHMTGTDDLSPLEGFGVERRREVFDHVTAPHQILTILNGGDHMVFTGSRGQLAENPNRGDHEAIIKTLSLAYWDAWLKDDQDARTWLDQSATSWLNARATWESK